jgi:hypothetical protein
MQIGFSVITDPRRTPSGVSLGLENVTFGRWIGFRRPVSAPNRLRIASAGI